jgi:aspartyl-tRNA(Asn)/glutamyl-tRNA(Gln) amidotransferase subunit B
VTEPDINSPEQAREWLTLLRTTLRQLGVSDVNMEEGSLRCDGNVSIRPAGSNALGTKTELKNMNSFRFLERGLRAEIERQERLLADGYDVIQETMHFDPVSGSLTPLRSKEEAHDYRYFPEPDLVPLVATEAMLEAARAELPAELPAERAARFERELGLNPGRAREFAFRAELGDYFEQALAADGADLDPVELSNWIPQLVERIGSDADPAQSKVSPGSLATLASMVKGKEVSRDAAREVLTRLTREGGDPRAIVEAEGLGALGGEENGLGEIVERALASDPAAAEKVREGNMKAIGPLVGFVMRETKGRADGAEVRRLILERLQSPTA